MKRIILYAAACALAAACQTAPELSEKDSGSGTVSVPESAVVPGVMKIRVSDELAERLLAAADAAGNIQDPDKAGLVLPGINVTSVRTSFRIGGRFEARQRKAGLHKWFTVEFDDNMPVTRAVSGVSETSGIEISEPALRISPAAVTMNDPRYGDQWHYHNTGNQEWMRAGIDMKLQEAWDAYEIFGNSNVTVAVIDGGVDYSHQDLAGNIWTNEAEANGTAGTDDDGNGYIDDIHGFNFVTMTAAINPETHGTHVAGTVAAVNNNGVGVCGVAGGRYPEPGARLMCLQMMDDRYDNRGADIGLVFQYAADNGANIAQNSWGYEISPTYMPESDAAAIDYFIDNAGCDEDGNQLPDSPMKGGVVICAEGNNSLNYDYPSGYERVIAVAAIGPDGVAASYTNYGPWVDVCAPGGDQNRYGTSAGVLSTVPGGSYSYLQGTSMACPHVSGLAALVLSVMGGEGYTNEQLTETILNCTDDSIYDYNPDMEGQLGRGLVNAMQALASFSDIAPEPVKHLEASAASNTLVFTADVPADEDNGSAYYFNLYYSTSAFTADDLSSVQSARYTIANQTATPEGYRTFTLQGLEFETQYWYAVSASDFARNESELSAVGTITTGANNAPEISINADLPLTLTAAETRTIEITAEDPDGHSVSLSLDNGGNPAVALNASGSRGTVTINALRSDTGTFSFSITATDEYGMSVSEEVQYTILPNNAPEVTHEIGTQYINGIGSSVTLNTADYFTDKDGEALTVLGSVSDRNIVSYSYAEGVVTLTGLAAGNADVKLAVTDARGANVSVQFTVQVRAADRSFDVYPNPVISTVNVRTPEQTSCNVTVRTASGSEVCSEDVTISMASPLSIDMSHCAPGQYVVILTYPDGQTAKSSFVKL